MILKIKGVDINLVDFNRSIKDLSTLNSKFYLPEELDLYRTLYSLFRITYTNENQIEIVNETFIRLIFESLTGKRYFNQTKSKFNSNAVKEIVQLLSLKNVPRNEFLFHFSIIKSLHIDENQLKFIVQAIKKKKLNVPNNYSLQKFIKRIELSKLHKIKRKVTKKLNAKKRRFNKTKQNKDEILFGNIKEKLPPIVLASNDEMDNPSYAKEKFIRDIIRKKNKELNGVIIYEPGKGHEENEEDILHRK